MKRFFIFFVSYLLFGFAVIGLNNLIAFKSETFNHSLNSINISQVQNMFVNTEETYLSKRIILLNQNDSLNYTSGLCNGAGIKESYLKTENSTKAINAFFSAFDSAYYSIESRNEMFDLGQQISKSLKQQKATGLLGDSTIEFDFNIVMKGFKDALVGNYSNNPENVDVFIQNTMKSIKENRSLIKDKILVGKLNYAFGFSNGNGIKNYYLAADSTNVDSLKAKINLLLKGLNNGRNSKVDEKYAEISELGTRIGTALKEQNKSGLMNDSTLKINIKIIKQGLINGLTGSDIQMTAQEAQAYLNSTMELRQKNQMDVTYKSNKEEGEKFLAENKLLDGVVTTQSGLQYKVLQQGKGVLPVETSRVKVNYHGTLIDGTVFDSSVNRGEPTVFGLNQVIPGWSEALKLMPIGSKYILYIPNNLAYGDKKMGAIKPFSVLIFEIQLISIEE